MARIALASSLLLVLAACSSASSEAGPSSSPPASVGWADAPRSIEVGEGLEVSVPFAPPSSAEVTVDAPEGITTRTEDGKLFVRAGYGMGDVTPIVVTVTEPGRAPSTTSVPLTVKHLAWTAHYSWKTGPSAREHGAFFVDPASNAALLFQGSGFKPQLKPLDDAWRFDLGAGTWSTWTPTGDLPKAPGAARRVAQLRGQSLAYLHGGYVGFRDTEDADPDLFRVDVHAGTFHRIAQEDAPEGRELHVFGQIDRGGDPTSARLVLFGGVTPGASTAILGDTWIADVDGDVARWSRVATTRAPSARYGSFVGVDAKLQRLFLWSGAQMPTSASDTVNAASDAWALDFSSDPPTWSKLSPSGDAPHGRRNGCSMYDEEGHRLFVFGGTSDGRTSEKGLWVLDLTKGREAWTRLVLAGEPPVRSSGFGFVDANGRLTCGFGNDADLYTDVHVLGYAQ